MKSVHVQVQGKLSFDIKWGLGWVGIKFTK